MLSFAQKTATESLAKGSSNLPPFTYNFSRTADRSMTNSWVTTHFILQDERHPLHIGEHRKLAGWDPDRLHWAIKHPNNLNKKKVVRTWASRRVKEALIAELRNHGWDREGRALDTEAVGQSEKSLKGTLNVLLSDAAITAPYSSIVDQCRRALDKVFENQPAASTSYERRTAAHSNPLAISEEQQRRRQRSEVSGHLRRRGFLNSTSRSRSSR